MKKHLIALDLDGTLLYDWKTLKDETKQYLMDLKAQGHHLVIATGRPFRSAIMYYELLELNTPIINYNGGLITWQNNPDFEEVNITVDKEAVIDIMQACDEHIDNAFCEIKDDIYLKEEREDIMDLLHYFGNATLNVGDLAKTLPGDTNGMIIVAKKNHGSYIEDYVKKHYSNKLLTRNWGDAYNFIIEVYTPYTNKGRALKHVAKALGVERKHIIAIGDGMNDLEMIAYAGTGVAVGNAHPDLKAIADVVSPYTHQESVIERVLSDYFSKKEEGSD